ncbi:MAG: O-antigen ligase family protein [Clostridia bacterium]|nr:O-antigen ligase family protein [Clostridia bacterium]
MLFLYLTIPFWEWLFSQMLELSGNESLAVPCVLAVVYLPVVALFFAAKQKLPVDFFRLMLFLCLYLVVTFLIHPEYEYYYTREQYGVWDYVLRPNNGLYVYLFIRLADDPRRIIRALRVSGYVIYAFSALRLYVATVKGFWMEEGSRGQEYMSSYNMNYGYTLLLFVCCFLFCGFEQKRLRDMILALAGCVMILCGGSRGPFLDIAVFAGIYWLLRFRRSRRKIVFASVTALASGAAAKLWRPLLTAFQDLLEWFNVNSRTLRMMLDGTVAVNNGRDVFWDASFQMIRENPLGYGAMGARHVLCGIHIVGHPHNFFIEILIEYGVIVGPLLIVLMLASSLRIFLQKEDNGWQGVFLIFFANACQLLTSYTYWHSPALWGALAAGVCWYRAERRSLCGRAERKTL